MGFPALQGVEGHPNVSFLLFPAPTLVPCLGNLARTRLTRKEGGSHFPLVAPWFRKGLYSPFLPPALADNGAALPFVDAHWTDQLQVRLNLSEVFGASLKTHVMVGMRSAQRKTGPPRRDPARTAGSRDPLMGPLCRCCATPKNSGQKHPVPAPSADVLPLGENLVTLVFFWLRPADFLQAYGPD